MRIRIHCQNIHPSACSRLRQADAHVRPEFRKFYDLTQHKPMDQGDYED